MNTTSTSSTSGRARSRPRRSKLARRVSTLYREAILDAAERVFGKAGFGGAHMADIARAAGIAVGSLYTYFDSKEAIFAALHEHRAASFHALLEEVAAEHPAPVERLRAMIRAFFAYIEQHSAIFALFVESGRKDEWARSCPPGKIEDRRAKFYALYGGAIAEAQAQKQIRPGLPAEELVDFLAGAMMGVVRAWIRDPRRGALTQRADFVVDLFLGGAGGKR